MREGNKEGGWYRDAKNNVIHYMNIKSQAPFFKIYIQQQRGEKRKESPNKAS